MFLCLWADCHEEKEPHQSHSMPCLKSQMTEAAYSHHHPHPPHTPLKTCRQPLPNLMRRQTEQSLCSHIFPKTALVSWGERDHYTIKYNQTREYSGAEGWKGEQGEEKMRSDPCGSCFWCLTSPILTLSSNPITLPNWIGCVHCSDGIRASVHQRRDERSPVDNHFLFFVVRRQLKPFSRNILEERELQGNYK